MGDLCMQCYSQIGLAVSKYLNPPPRFCDKCIDASADPAEVRRILSDAYTTEKEICDSFMNKPFRKYGELY